MIAHERHEALQRLLAEQGAVVISDLARDWGVSEMTLRRDLRRLEDQGVVSRVHGGAVAGGALRFKARLGRYRSEKAAAAAKLVAYAPEGGCVYLDGSTTVYGLIGPLAALGGITAVTNNVDTFAKLSAVSGIRPVLIGGELNAATDNLVGPLARRCLLGLAFEVAFCSAFALDLVAGPCEPALEDAEVKQWVAERSARVCLALDHHKFEQRAGGAWQVEPAQAVLATDLDPQDPRLDPHRARFGTIV